MKTLIVTAAALVLATGAFAQTQTLEERYDQGGINALSNMEQRIVGMLQDAEVPISCIGQLTLGHISQIDGMLRSSTNTAEVRRRVGTLLRRVCTEL